MRASGMQKLDGDGVFGRLVLMHRKRAIHSERLKIASVTIIDLQEVVTPQSGRNTPEILDRRWFI
jgi:hypothetical protein